MSGAKQPSTPKARLLALLATLPAGRVTTTAAIGAQLGIAVRLVETMLAALDENDRRSSAWHRVVANGGAIGRHARRDQQIARLAADGVTVSPAGIVQDLADRMVVDLASIAAGTLPPLAMPAAQAPGRARGRKDRPASSI